MSDGVLLSIEDSSNNKVVLDDRTGLSGRTPGTVADLSQPRAAEGHIVDLIVELAHLSRVTTMGRMAAALVHELGQPLGAIENYASVCLGQIESQTGSPASALTAIREVMNEAHRAEAIIKRMRSFIRKQPPKTEPVDINELVLESVHMMEFEFRHRRIRPDLRLAGNVPKVLGDTVQIEQVLVNLLLNAAEAIGDGATVQNALTVETALYDGGQSVQVCVIDTGPGMSQENMRRLFEPFFTSKPDGLGIGLNICRSIVESEGGRLFAARNPDRGMRFSFTVPAAA